MTLDKLAEIARKATPGPYFLETDKHHTEHVAAVVDPRISEDGYTEFVTTGYSCGYMTKDADKRNAVHKEVAHANNLYFAAMNPTVALALIEVARAAGEYADHNFGMQVQGGEHWAARKKSVDDLKAALSTLHALTGGK